MLFKTADELKIGMRLAKPIYNKNGVMLYDRNSRLTEQGIVSIQNFGLIGVYILERAEPVPPMTSDDIEFERFQAMSIFTIKDIMDEVVNGKEPKGLYPFANQVLKNYGNLSRKINFVQNLRSAEDYAYKHALNTAILCALMSKKLKFEFKKQLDIVVAGILYDIGNLLIPVELRKKKSTDLEAEELERIHSCHYAGYQLLNKGYDMDPNVRRVASLVCRDLHGLTQEGDVVPAKKIDEVEALKVASVYDNMTAMKYGEAPLSEVVALRYLLDKENGFDQISVKALVDSINILQPGVCVELTNGDRGLVVTEGAVSVLEPFVLTFKDNKILNLSDSSLEIAIKDIQKTMDNRHVVNRDLLESYKGKTVYLGEKI